MLIKIPDEVCKCDCHKDGQEVFCSCFSPECCEFICKKYINEDGSFDEERYNALVKEKAMRIVRGGINDSKRTKRTT